MFRPRRCESIVLSALLGLSGCGFVRTPYLLNTLNSGGSSGPVTARASTAERVAREVRLHVEDSYFDPKAVGDWLANASAHSEPIAAELACLRKPPMAGAGPCYQKFDADAPTTWGLPPAPTASGANGAFPGSADAVYLTEADVERFAANARWIASSLLVLEDSLGQELKPEELTAGVQNGMQQARAYLLARHWHRDPKRPTTALVMSGGGGTGAFTAGFVSRIMDVFQQCHHAPGGDQCPDARVDLVVGTSTGTLVGVLTDLFQVPGQEARAERMLIDNYTCSTEKDLYCKHDDWDWRLAENMRGLMHFDGIERKLTEALSPEMQTNASELVTLAVDYDSGDILAQSDQDPVDRASGADRVQTVLASIVEPVLSDPVDYLMANGSRVRGTYIDAGVRSGLPLQQAIWRGAERALVISTGNVDVSPAGHAASALPILLRTIDLSTSQNLVGEVQQSEFQAAARRLAEYNICESRMSTIDTIARKEFCERKVLWPTVGAEAAVTPFIGPGLFPEVARSWKSAWVYRPENGSPGEVGYSFAPKPMRDLFKDGVRKFQARCQEALRLLNVPPDVRNKDYACGMSADNACAHAEAEFKPLSACHPDDHAIPNCP